MNVVDEAYDGSLDAYAKSMKDVLKKLFKKIKIVKDEVAENKAPGLQSNLGRGPDCQAHV